MMRLRGHIALPEGHSLVFDDEPLSSSKGLLPDCCVAGKQCLVVNRDERFDRIEWRGFGLPSKHIAIIPLMGGASVPGYLIVGTNPCRPHDEPCQQFLKDLGRMVSSIVSAAHSAEEARKREQQLEKDLAISDMKLRHLIEHASVGMIHMSMDGDILWVNEHYYRLAGRSAAQNNGKLKSSRHITMKTYQKRKKHGEIFLLAPTT
jgi:PAS domain-containing protein